MGPNAEPEGAVFSKKRDRRAFNHGALTRLTRMDELPQLLNILRGELSLLGPHARSGKFLRIRSRSSSLIIDFGTG